MVHVAGILGLALLCAAWMALQLASGRVRRLTEHPGTDWDPYYAPDGRHLIWSSDREVHFEIWIGEADGRNPRRLSCTTGCWNSKSWLWTIYCTPT